MEYQGIEGIFGSRASLAYDVAFLLELAVIPMFIQGLTLLLVRKNYETHKRLMLIVSGVFAVAAGLFAFEFFSYDWRTRVGVAADAIPRITYMTLTIHLAFLSITALIWLFLLVNALRKIPSPPRPCEFGPTYVFWLVLLGLQLFISTLTGWEFYLLAFCY